MNRFRKLLSDHFVAGFLALMPFAVIVWIGFRFFGALWALYEVFPATWQPSHWFTDAPLIKALVSAALAVATGIVVLLGVSSFGWISKRYLGQKLIEGGAQLIQYIPVLRGIHSSLDQLLKSLHPGDTQQFSRVVYVEFPKKDSWTLGFVTGEFRDPKLTGPEGRSSTGGSSERWLSLFVPTTPNPTSGFYLITRESDVRDTGLKAEEAFKVLLSLGIAKR